MMSLSGRVLARSLFCCIAAGLIVSAPAQAKRTSEDGGRAIPVPALSFSADRDRYVVGDRAQLSWASDGTRYCWASGDWSGRVGTQGAYWTDPLDGPKSYQLRCRSWSGRVAASVELVVTAAGPEPAPVPDPAPEPEPTPEPDPAPEPEPQPDPVPVPEPQPEPQPDPVPEPEPVRQPTVTLAASVSEIAAGGSTTLSWSSTDADGCQATGGWSGPVGVGGSRSVGPISSTTTFSLTCTGAGGSASTTARVTVVPPPAVTLTSADTIVAAGGSTTLAWSARDAYACQASGGWTGTRAMSGSQPVGPIDGSTTFTLSCTGTGGSAVQMVSVSALGEVSISWIAPTANVDGTPLRDLDRYRIYYGPDSRSYTNSIDVTNPSATSHTFSATSGEYHVTMTAIDREGNESAYANEILRSVP